MRRSEAEAEFMSGFDSAAKQDAVEFKRLDARMADLEAALREAIATFDVIAIQPADPNDGINHAKNNMTLARHGASRARVTLGAE